MQVSCQNHPASDYFTTTQHISPSTSTQTHIHTPTLTLCPPEPHRPACCALMHHPVLAATSSTLAKTNANTANNQAPRRNRERELDPQVYASRRGHAPQISISDDNHHVTEAIGGMYGDDDFENQPRNRSSTRPLSFIPSPLGDTLESGRQYFDDDRSPSSRIPLSRTPSSEHRSPILGHSTSPGSYAGSPIANTSRSGSIASMTAEREASNGQMSPSSLHRTPSQPVEQQFEITDLNSTAAVAQELSNLQAIRRMSMDVNGVDPDLPQFNSGWTVPAVAPSAHGDEEDPSRLFWVPASVHPELAPTAFKTFIQDRVKTIKRSSLSVSEGDLSPDVGQEKGSLRRKKSMLSRQVNDPNGYRDGAERLEHKRSSSGMPVPIDKGLVSLQELEDLASDPSSLVRRMSVDSQGRNSQDSQNDGNSGEDKPILAPKPPGQTLKRSTRTTYRRGSQRKGSAFGKRRGLPGDMEHDEMPQQPSPTKQDGIPQLPSLPDLGQFESGQFGLTRVQTEPIQPKPDVNFSRPGRRARTPPVPQGEFNSYDSYSRANDTRSPEPENEQRTVSPDHHPFQSRIASNGRSTVSMPPNGMPVPTIIETPPPNNDLGKVQSLPVRPERSSSIDNPASSPPKTPLPGRPAQQRPPLTRPATLQHTRQAQKKPENETEHDTAQHPVSLPGGTGDLAPIPFHEEKKGDKKSKEKKDEGPRKTSWNWFLSSDEKEKEKEQAKKGKSKVTKPHDRSHDNTRLDVLQHSIEGKGVRESVVLDRSTVHVEPEKKPARKVSNDGKKEKESGIFSSLFGGGKKKSDKESHGKRSGSSLRGLSPDPPQKILQPDIDYNWSRFSILEERAIYRMAHMKLANPRRELYSQVLLSNFMYSYLAKVQQMHPQIQIPQSAAQKQQQRQAQQQKKAEQQREQQQQQGSSSSTEEFAQYQRYQEVSASSSKDAEYILD
jgi:Activator of mitotic machinery Cdc14 phosphatase activation C-term